MGRVIVACPDEFFSWRRRVSIIFRESLWEEQGSKQGALILAGAGTGTCVAQ